MQHCALHCDDQCYDSLKKWIIKIRKQLLTLCSSTLTWIQHAVSGRTNGLEITFAVYPYYPHPKANSPGLRFKTSDLTVTLFLTGNWDWSCVYRVFVCVCVCVHVCACVCVWVCGLRGRLHSAAARVLFVWSRSASFPVSGCPVFSFFFRADQSFLRALCEPDLQLFSFKYIMDLLLYSKVWSLRCFTTMVT